MRRVLLVSILSLSIVAPAFARTKPAPTAPGTYKEWGQDIDSIEIINTFKMADYDKVVVLPFDTSKVPLPDKNAKWYGTLKMSLASYNQAFIEAFEKELKAKAAVTEASETPKTSRTLVLRGAVEELDP